MNEKEISDIVTSAHEVCKCFNLFAGYSPKKTDEKKKEILFWRNVVNYYGLFCDCDKYVIKEKDNLVLFFYEKSFISRRQYQDIRNFYFDISALRAWFCHNRDITLYFPKEDERTIRQFLDNALLFATKKPIRLEDVTDAEWEILNMNLVTRFMMYLDVMKESISKIQHAENKEVLVAEWRRIYANALFNDSELISNVLADIYCYLRLDAGMDVKGIGKGVELLRGQLKNQGYSSSDIIAVIDGNRNSTLSNMEIIRHSMSGIAFEI